MTRVLFDLCGRDPEVRFSPFCWLVKFALYHKGLAFETTPLTFTDKENYPDTSYGKLPVLQDGDDLVRDSKDIIAYLDKTYPENPLLADGQAKARYAYCEAFCYQYVFMILSRFLGLHIYEAIADQDKSYFRETREVRHGTSLEQANQDPSFAHNCENAFTVLAAPLAVCDYFGGDAPDASDYLVGGILMWVRNVGPAEFIPMPEGLDAWFNRMLDHYDGFARASARAKQSAA